jgi:hypothetical protein
VEETHTHTQASEEKKEIIKNCIEQVEENKRHITECKMLKKYAMKVSNTFSPINYKQSKNGTHGGGSSRSSSSDDGGDSSRCSSICESNYDQNELNRNLFIENYLIGRGNNKTRSSSLSIADDALKDVPLKRNNRRKSLIEKRDDRLKINRNHLFSDSSKIMDRAIMRHHKSASDYYYSNGDRYYGMDDEKSLGCDMIETSAPTMRKIDNILREFVNFE